MEQRFCKISKTQFVDLNQVESIRVYENGCDLITAKHSYFVDTNYYETVLKLLGFMIEKNVNNGSLLLSVIVPD